MDNKTILNCLLEYFVHCVRNDTKVRLTECIKCNLHCRIKYDETCGVLSVVCGEEEEVE